MQLTERSHACLTICLQFHSHTHTHTHTLSKLHFNVMSLLACINLTPDLSKLQFNFYYLTCDILFANPLKNVNIKDCAQHALQNANL